MKLGSFLSVSLTVLLTAQAVIYSPSAQATDCVVTGMANGITYNAGGILPLAVCAAEAGAMNAAPAAVPVAAPVMETVAPIATPVSAPAQALPVVQAPVVQAPVVSQPSPDKLLGIETSTLIWGSAAALALFGIVIPMINGTHQNPTGTKVLVCDGFSPISGKSYRFHNTKKFAECIEPGPHGKVYPTALAPAPTPLPRFVPPTGPVIKPVPPVFKALPAKG